jgi:hypothetical protein
VVAIALQIVEDGDPLRGKLEPQIPVFLINVDHALPSEWKYYHFRIIIVK